MSERKKQIHVMHLIGSTGLYGAERWILAIMRATDADSIRSTLINLVDAEGEASEVVVAARQRGLNALDFFTGGTFNPLVVFRLARWVRSQHVQIIHGHGFKSDVIGLLAARIAGCKVVTTPHGWSLEANRKLQLYEKLDRMMFQFMDVVCPLSPELYSGIRKSCGATPVKLILNGVDIDEVKSVSPAPEHEKCSYLIGYIGQLIERKDLGTLVAAVKQLSREDRKVRLMIIGDGPKKAELWEDVVKLGIEDDVKFLGFRPDALAFLKIFDVFVLPSRMEGIPRCVMEAMAATVPVIVSNIPGNNSLVKHGETGLLFTPGDIDDLADKIRYIMLHFDEAKAMAIRGTELIEREHSSRRMANEYVSMYYYIFD